MLIELIIILNQLIINEINCFKIDNILSLEFNKLECDYDYYMKLKDEPLMIRYGFENNKLEYLISNRFIIKRNKIKLITEIAYHTIDSFNLYNSLKYDNTVIQFKDAILTTNLTKSRSMAYFKHGCTYDQLIESSGNRVNNDEHFYFFLKSSTKLIDLDYLIYTNLSGLIIFKKIENNFEIIDNLVSKSNFKIDTILFNYLNNDKQLIEFSNKYATIREYNLNDSKENRTLYHNLLNCFMPLCEGARFRGIITLDYDKLYFFLEDHYIRIEQNDLFEKEINIHKMEQYKKIENIKDFPLDGKLNLEKNVYVRNLYFSNTIKSIISINDNWYFISYDRDLDDLIIIDQKLNFNLKDGYLSFSSATYPIAKSTATPFNIFNEYGLDRGEYLNYNYTLFETINYQDKLKGVTNFKDYNMRLVAIVSFKRNQATIAFFSTEFTISYVQRNDRLKKLEDKRERIDTKSTKLSKTYEFKFLKCYYDYIDDKFNGKLAENNSIDEIKINNLFQLIKDNILIISLIITIFLILILYYLFNNRDLAKKQKDEKRLQLFYNKFTKFIRTKNRLKLKKINFRSNFKNQQKIIKPFSTGYIQSTNQTSTYQTSTYQTSTKDISNSDRQIKDSKFIRMTKSINDYQSDKSTSGLKSSVNRSFINKKFESEIIKQQIPPELLPEHFLANINTKTAKANISDIIQKNIDMIQTQLKSSKSSNA